MAESPYIPDNLDSVEAYPTEYGNVVRVGTRERGVFRGSMYDKSTGKKATRASFYKGVERPIWRFAQMRPMGFDPFRPQGFPAPKWIGPSYHDQHVGHELWRRRGQGGIKDWRQPQRLSHFNPLNNRGVGPKFGFSGTVGRPDLHKLSGLRR